MNSKNPTQEEIKKILDDLRNNPIVNDKNDVMQMDYNTEYLSSKIWGKIKRRILKRDKKICFLCGGSGSIVHHKSYEREVLEGNADHMLITVCDGCHNIIHFNENGSKRSAEDQEIILSTKQLQIEIPEPKIDLRRRSPIKPPEWPRMTAIQRTLWHEKVLILTCEKKVKKGHTEYSHFLKK